MVTLPQLLSQDTVFNRYQTQLKTALASITSNPVANGTVITNVSLIAGQLNKVPTGLGQPLTVWVPVRVRSQATIWDTQDSNTTEGSTFLYLYTSANVVIDLLVG